MFAPSTRLLLEARQIEIRAEIERASQARLARMAGLARRPRRRSIRRSLGRQMIRIGARLAADPALHRARTI